ncbi:MAG: ribonuclease [Oscillospiraceae bacterium]|nr:ribonuclease [Oscillospiraceae bacterium]
MPGADMHTPPPVSTPVPASAASTPAPVEIPLSPPEAATPAPVVTPAPAAAAKPEGISEDGEYSDPEQVAEYIHLYGHLPSNFITKSKALSLGWESRKGNLWDVAPGKSIGGDRFGNYEGLLPNGQYRECDVNYAGGYRGEERLIYNTKGNVWYTGDHYETFTQLY